MAIIFDDQCYKVTESENNFVNDYTSVKMSVYASKDTRDREKSLSNQANEVISNIQDQLALNMNNLIARVNEITPIDKIEDVDAFYNEHPDIKSDYLNIQSIQDEGLILIDSILKKSIDFDNLKHKELWISLGLTADLCIPIEHRGEVVLNVDRIVNANLSELYGAVKEKIVSEVEDC